MRFVFGKRFVLAACSLAFIVAASGGSAYARSGGDAAGKAKDTARVPPHWYTTTGFAGFFPPVGARATLPAKGEVLLELPGGSLYADGRIVTDRYGVRRLTPWGARLLWSKIRAIGLAAGLFRHYVEAAVASQHHISRWYHVCSGRRMIVAHVGTSKGAHPQNPLPPAQGRALARIDTLFATATRRLPASAWADRRMHPYVPSGYDLSFDRAAPDPAKMPSPAREELAKYQPLLHHWSQGITTNQARALMAAFRKSGLKPVSNPGSEGLSFSLPIAHPIFGTDSTILRVFPADPPIGGRNNCKYPVP